MNILSCWFKFLVSVIPDILDICDKFSLGFYYNVYKILVSSSNLFSKPQMKEPTINLNLKVHHFNDAMKIQYLIITLYNMNVGQVIEDVGTLPEVYIEHKVSMHS